MQFVPVIFFCLFLDLQEDLKLDAKGCASKKKKETKNKKKRTTDKDNNSAIKVYITLFALKCI